MAVEIGVAERTTPRKHDHPPDEMAKMGRVAGGCLVSISLFPCIVVPMLTLDRHADKYGFVYEHGPMEHDRLPTL